MLHSGLAFAATGDIGSHAVEEPTQTGRARRSRTSRAPRVRALAVALVVVFAALSVWPQRAGETSLRTASALAGEPVGRAADSVSAPPAVPAAASIRRAWRYARARGGEVSIAVVDTEGRLRGRRAGRRYVSASIVKAMVLVAELRRLRRERLPIDGETEELLRAMITASDNDAADVIYSRSGDAGLEEVARLVGMRRVQLGGHWTATQVTAADMARFFARLRGLVGPHHRRLALRLLASVIEEQRWGLPRAAAGWHVHFKGGWRATGSGELVHQGAWLRGPKGGLAIAVLTDGQPSQLYAIHTVRGIADRLLAPQRRH